MTEVTQVRSAPATQTSLGLHYRVAMPQPRSHLFEVTLQVQGWNQASLDLKMPVWTPGSYLVREYARHVQDFRVEQGLDWQKLSKNHWRIQTAGQETLTVHYRVFANELTVRTNHLDASHAFFNGAALFFYLPGFERQPIQVTIDPPAQWQVSTTLSPVTGVDHTYVAPDFDTLVDSPFEIGQHQLREFEVLGLPHQYVVWGQSNADLDRIVADTQKIIETEAAIFQGLPYDRYLFILHLTQNSFGGLEHKDSCALIYPRFNFQTEDGYQRFIQLVAHEFFHLWNVKRIRPKGLERFDYDGENYTPSLWFSEGTTSYYDLLLPLRAGIYNPRTYLKHLSKEISRFLTTPGRQVQTLSESSFDAWIKLYRRDHNSDNNQISYYLKGEMVSLLLDLLIRNRHDNQRSLDDVLRLLWRQFGQPEIGFTPDQLQQTIETVADQDLSEFFQHCLNTTAELPFDQYLEPFGLKILPDTADLPPFLGITVHSDNGRELIRFVEYGSPAQQSGIDPDDELLAIDSLKVKASQLNDRLKNYQPGDKIAVTVFHQDELRTYPVVLAEPCPKTYQVVPIADPMPSQFQRFQGWLGGSLTELKA